MALLKLHHVAVRLTAVAVLLVVAACQRRNTPAPNIVLVSIDSLRPDHLGAYGYSRPTSPNIDRIATEGVVFQNAFSVTSWTLPSHLTMLSGLYPEAHGVVSDEHRLAEKVELLPETLARHGYHSAAVVSGPYLNSRFGYAQGWETYDDSIAPADNILTRSREAASRVSAPKVHARALELLDALQAQPFFLFVHHFDVHYDYTPPEPWNRAFDSAYHGPIDGRVVSTGILGMRRMPPRDLEHLTALYDGEIAWVDHWIGELDRALAERGLDGSTLLVVTADHGEEFFEHSRFGHRKALFDETLRIPLIMRLPERRFAGEQIAEPVSLVDLAPTLTRIVQADSARGFMGRDLLQSRFGRLVAPRRRDLFASHAIHSNRAASLIRGPWKLIAALDAEGAIDLSRLLLTNREQDAGEHTNLASVDPRLTARFVISLRRATEHFAAVRSLHGPEQSATSPLLEEQIRALGYL